MADATDGGLIPFPAFSIPGAVAGMHLVGSVLILGFAAVAVQSGQFVQTGFLVLLAAMIATVGVAMGRIVHRRSL
jgi:hypothetical protein